MALNSADSMPSLPPNALREILQLLLAFSSTNNSTMYYVNGQRSYLRIKSNGNAFNYSLSLPSIS